MWKRNTNYKTGQKQTFRFGEHLKTVIGGGVFLKKGDIWYLGALKKKKECRGRGGRDVLQLVAHSLNRSKDESGGLKTGKKRKPDWAQKRCNRRGGGH